MVDFPKRIEVITIGDELLDGRVIDTNTVRFALRLRDVGATLQHHTTVSDDTDAIIGAAQAAVDRGCDLCLVSGGLGPTSDDITAETLAEFAGVSMVHDEAQAKRIHTWIEARGRRVGPNQLKQADRPEGAELISNPVGTAPGFSLLSQGCRFISVPGVPIEFDHMVEVAIIEPLMAAGARLERVLVRTFGLIEAEVAERISGLNDLWPEVRLGFQVKFPEILVLLRSESDARASLDAARDYLYEKLGHYIYNENDVQLPELMLSRLRDTEATLATAESCTGGLIGSLLTDIAGSSDVYQAGIISYSNEAKEKFLGVKHETLEEHGAVSEETALQMAIGAREGSAATWGISTTGISGPTGGSTEKPVGTVWIACAGPSGAIAKKYFFPFGRLRHKQASAYAALDMLRREVLRTA
ncbi:CinA family nicotinamide mononucleotide deamidase-related protein [Myxococcota bacterium]|nr:CinA family nicotinamide mononucleotide deamidase-related protein [Myxococcota bacterium]